MKAFYYTFGSSKEFPYQNGWIEVYAKNLEEAHKVFRKHFPNRTKNRLNCAFYYTEEEWNAIDSSVWAWYKCYGKLYQYPYSLTEIGESIVNIFINELKVKRKEILDAGIDTADETVLPDEFDILSDIESFIDEDGDYYNCWGVTDNYNSDYMLYLRKDVDFVENCEWKKEVVDLIDKRKEKAKDANELLDHLIGLIGNNDERFSHEWSIGGESITMEIFDKLKEIGYVVKIEPIEYDEDGNALNVSF